MTMSQYWVAFLTKPAALASRSRTVWVDAVLARRALDAASASKSRTAFNGVLIAATGSRAAVMIEKNFMVDNREPECYMKM